MKLKIVFNYRFFLILLSIFLFLEGGLRLKLGLGNPVLSQIDLETGYRFQPNQKIFRFGNAIVYNQYSQRSDRILPFKPQNTLRILMVGDSVLNGGTLTDQTQTISEQLEAKMKAMGMEESLSWYADLRRFGTVPHAGFGLGFDRLLNYITGMENIRDAIPYPRVPQSAPF